MTINQVYAILKTLTNEPGKIRTKYILIKINHDCCNLLRKGQNISKYFRHNITTKSFYMSYTSTTGEL